MIRVPKKALTATLAAALALSAGLVHHFEGTRYAAYRDMGGTWTICEGHTRGVHEGDTATAAQCDAWRTEDLLIANQSIDRCIHTPLTVEERAALQDAVFNIGPRVVCDSALQRKANAGQPWCAELLRWDYVAGRKIAWQTSRRGAEHALCSGLAP
jgi:lysozyme